MADTPSNPLRESLLALGFDVVRFVRVDSPADGAEALDAWLAAGMQAEMTWLAKTPERRRDPRLVLEGTRSMILLGVNYSPDAAGAQGVGLASANLGPGWARYARYEDYHDTMKPALIAAGKVLERELGLGETDYRYYVDTGPVLERSWAHKAGLGYVGKNAMLISREFGNWLFLAAILVRADLPPDAPVASSDKGVGALCGRCTRCLGACPTKALVAPGVLDARRCISYLTIENKGMIPEEFRAAIGTRVYGCDVCAEVCPWNRFAQQSRSLLLKAKDEIVRLSLRELLQFTPERFAEVFSRSPIKRIKLTGLLRNACVAAGNSGDSSLIPELEILTRHDSEILREHASWARANLGR